MKNKNEKSKYFESGSVVIEAALALPLFMFGFLFILSFITVMRAERAVQLGIDKAAADIAAYCCLTGETAELYEKDLFEKTPEQICRIISSEKIRENDKYGLLKKTNGFSVNSIDFSGSDIMSEDDRIKIQAEYEVRPWTFGAFGGNNIVLKMKNSAVTRAMTGNKSGSSDDSSIWQELPFRRGALWIKKIKEENSDRAVKKGYGIDLYYEETGKVSQVFSLDLFSRTYSEKDGSDENDAGHYTIKNKNVENKIREYASELLKNTEKYGDKVYRHMENGTGKKCDGPSEKPELIIIVPEEVKQNQKMKESFENIVSKVTVCYEITVKTVFREKALKGG